MAEMTQTKTQIDSAYWSALQKRVCAVCLDQRDDGQCGLPHHRVCALKKHLPQIVAVAHGIESTHMDAYVEAVQQRICAHCPEQQSGRCHYRDHAECALYTYLPLVLEAVTDADEQLGLAP